MIRFDYLPVEMTQGEIAAVLSSDSAGWITPPIFSSITPYPPRTWSSADAAYLERRQLFDIRKRRRDGMWCFRLNAAGWALRQRLQQETTQ